MIKGQVSVHPMDFQFLANWLENWAGSYILMLLIWLGLGHTSVYQINSGLTVLLVIAKSQN